MTCSEVASMVDAGAGKEGKLGDSDGGELHCDVGCGWREERKREWTGARVVGGDYHNHR